MSSSVVKRTILAVTFLLVIAGLATYATVFESNPGRLAIEIGLLLAFFSTIAMIAKKWILQALSVGTAATEFTLERGVLSVFWGSFILLLLGFLYLMRV